MTQFATPAFSVDETVYLRESAGVGFLEAYIVTSARFNTAGRVEYELRTGIRQGAVPTAGDAVGLPSYQKLVVPESDLVTYCEALELAVAYAQTTLASLTAKLEACE